MFQAEKFGHSGIHLAALCLYLAGTISVRNSVASTDPLFDQLRHKHDQVLRAMNTEGEKGGPLELDDPRLPPLLNQGWTLAGEWAAAYLNNHPAPTTQELDRALVGFAPKPQGTKSQYGDFLEYHTYAFAGRLIRLSSSVYIGQACYWTESVTATFFIISRDHNGRFALAWSIKDLAERHYTSGDEIGRWAYLSRRAYYNGPLDVKRILPLPPGSNKHARFLVDAVQSANGGTALGQLSVWEWTGAEATPLLIDSYQYVWDEGQVHFNGPMLRIQTKEPTNSFGACGGCPEPRGVWTIRITPNGVTNLGHRFLRPEMKWSDELLSRVSNGKDAADMAAPSVSAKLKSAMEQIEKDSGPANASDKSESFYWGMLEGFRVLGPSEFELNLDEARLRFSYVLRDGTPYFTKVQVDQTN